MSGVARPSLPFLVALLAEGVDRNEADARNGTRYRVALLAEGVDRNLNCFALVACFASVALLAEGVDRNAFSMVTGMLFISRPPRGGRG